MATTPSLAALSDALPDAFVELTPPEQQLVRSAYRLLAQGRPVDVSLLAEDAGWTPEQVEARLADWPGVYRDNAGRLGGLWGLATEPVSAHQVAFEGAGTAWGWCALDPLFIVALLGTTAGLTTSCPTTGARIEVALDAGEVTRRTPASTVMTLLLPEGRFDVDVRQSFCHYVHLFASPATADRWIAQHPQTFWIPLDDAADLGRALAETVFTPH